MAAGEPVKSFYGSIYDSVTPAPVAADPTIANWRHEMREWARIRVDARAKYRQFQVKMRQEGEQARILHRKLEAQAKARAEREKKKAAEQTSSLARYKRLWWASVLGLLMSAIIYLFLFTDLLRDTVGSQLGTETKCDFVVPSLVRVSKLSVVFWIAVVMDLGSRIAAGRAVRKVIKLSGALRKDDAAYWKRLYGYSNIGIFASVMATSALLSSFIALAVRGLCECDLCLHLELASLAVLTWILLASIVGGLVIENGHRAIAGRRKKRSQEVPKQSG